MSEPNSAIPEVKYDLSFLKKPKWILFYSAVCFFIIISKLPISDQIDRLVKKSLMISPTCQLQIADYGFHFFPLPHLRVKHLNVPGKCIGPGNSNILLKEIRAYFRGPSFSPFGILFKVETEFEKIPVELYVTAGTSTITLVMKESLIPLDKVSNLIPNVKLSGQVKTDIYAEMGQEGLQGLNVNLQSKTFVIPGQMIQIFQMPPLNIQNMQIIATMDAKQNLQLKKFILGDENSPIRTEFAGTIKLHPNSMQTKLNIKGQLALSDEILKDGIFMLFEQNFLQTFDKEDNFYQITINESVGDFIKRMGM